MKPSNLAKRVIVDAEHPNAAVIADAAARLRAGGLVAFPTETVYGLGAHALDRAAVRRLFAAKGRPPNDPLIVHVASIAQAETLAAPLPDEARRLAAAFWPGPLTLVVRRSPLVPDEVTAGLDTVAIRMPAHPVARALIEAAGVPVAAPSANLFSRPSPTEASHVIADLGDRIDLVLDAGPAPVGVESTVLDLTSAAPRVLRPGAVTLEALRRVLPDVTPADETPAQTGATPASPGRLDKHYSPRAPLTLYIGTEDEVRAGIERDARRAVASGKRVGLAVATEDRAALSLPKGVVIGELGSLRDPATVAAQLYRVLRELDSAGVDEIFARAFPAAGGLGVAIHDRLRRAAAGRIVRCG